LPIIYKILVLKYSSKLENTSIKTFKPEYPKEYAKIYVIVKKECPNGMKCKKN